MNEQLREALSNLRFHPVNEKSRPTEPNAHPRTISIQDLRDGRQLAAYLQELRRTVYTSGESPAAIASQLSQRLSFLPLASFFAMSKFGLGLRVVPASTYVVSNFEKKSRNWLPHFDIEQLTEEPEPPTNRDAWREAIVQDSLGLIQPIFWALHRKTRVQRRTLGDNVSTYLQWLYRDKVPDSPLPKGAELSEDYQYIFRHTIPGIAGLEIKEERTSCCLAHTVGEGGNRQIKEKLEQSADSFCSGCPVIRKQTAKCSTNPREIEIL